MSNFVLGFRRCIFLIHGGRQGSKWSVLCGVPGACSPTNSKQNGLMDDVLFHLQHVIDDDDSSLFVET